MLEINLNESNKEENKQVNFLINYKFLSKNNQKLKENINKQ